MPLLVAAALLAASIQSGPISIVPKPVSVELRPGAFHIGANTNIAKGDGLDKIARYYENKLSPATGFLLPISANAGLSSIQLQLDPQAARLGPEGYVLEVSKNRILIRASAQAGLFYACQTLLQMLPPEIFRRAKVDRDW